MTKFNLSKERKLYPNNQGIYFEDKVQEFIRLLKEEGKQGCGRNTKKSMFGKEDKMRFKCGDFQEGKKYPYLCAICRGKHKAYLEIVRKINCLAGDKLK